MKSNFSRLLAACFAVLCPVFSGLFSQNLLLFDGETPNVQTCLYEWGGADSLQKHAGNWSFKANPDPYHGPGIEMHCQNAWRKNLSLYDKIQFWAKCSHLGKTFNVGIYAWPHQSRGQNINPYIENGAALDTTWRFVSIPVDSFKTAAFGMTSLDRLYFGGGNYGYNFWVDDIWAVDETPNHVDSLAVISNRAIELTLTERYDTTNVKTPAFYRISSPDDPAFADTLAVQSVGMHWFCDDFVDNTAGPVPVNIYKLFLLLPQPMLTGKHYHLVVEDVPDVVDNHFAEPQLLVFQFQDSTYINGSVKVNQVGYQPIARKYGYIGNYLGGLGAMPLDPTVFQIRDAATHAVAFSGTPNFRGNDPRLSGESVWDCDFTNFTTPGNYYLFVPGIGRSFDFEVSNSVYDDVARICARGLFYQRCGGDLPEANAGIWHRPACHTADGVIHPTCANTPLYNGEILGSTKTATHGWHDAGDYGKYVASAAEPLWDLMTAFELFPQKFDDNNNIPESGNAVPDILDEVKWELDWLAGMMETDGGVYFNCATTYWPNSVPHLDTPTRNLSQKTTFTTGQAAAIFAQAARVFEPYLPVFADSCLVWSQRAWAFLENHPTPEPPLGFHPIPNQIGGGDYSDNEGDADERAWALAELYKTTGDTAYHNLFTYWYAQHEPTFGWNAFKHFQTFASFTYCTTPHPTNQTWVNSYRNSVKTGLDGYVKIRTDQNKYRNGYRSEVTEWIGWGSYAQSAQYAWQFIKGFYLWPSDSSYLAYAKLNFDTQLGANPQNTSYITGVGDRSPMDPLQHTSHKDGIVPPNPGITVFGPMSHLSFGNSWNAEGQKQANLYPKGESDFDVYPTLRRYYDIFELVGMSEFGVASIAKATVAFSLFTSVNVSCTQNPYFLDADGDGFGNPAAGISACVQQPGYVVDNTDCNDSNASINPAASETGVICDKKDNDCDGQIDENNNLAVGFSSVQPTCFGGANGSIFSTTTGVSMPYNYLWSNSRTTKNINLLAAGTYSLKVTAWGGCTKTASVVLGQPTDILMSVATTATSATISVSGGTPIFTFNRSGTTAFQLNPVFSGLSAGGTYIFKTKDGNGCQKSVIKKLPTSMAPGSAAAEKNVISQNQFVIFPNPASDILNVEFLSNEKIGGQIAVIDLLGRILFSKNIEIENGSIFQIDAKDFAAGGYSLIFRNDAGKVEAVRFVVEKI